MLVERRPLNYVSLDPEVLPSGLKGDSKGRDKEARAQEGRPVEDEATLIQEALKGSQRAYTALLNSHRRTVYNLMRRMVSDEEEALDLSQEAFVRAFRSLHSFNPSFSFRSWIMTIASRIAIDFLRRKSPQTVSLDETEGITSESTTPETELQRKETQWSIERAVGSLPLEYRMVILLRHKEGMSYDEIARVLDLPVGTVKSRVYRAREILRKSLEGIYEPRGT